MARGIWGAASDGAYKAITGLWAADSTGTYRRATAAWAADSSGTYRQFWPNVGVLETFTAALADPPYLYARITASANNVTRIEVRSPSVTEPHATINASSGTTLIGPIRPGSRLPVFLRLFNVDGSSTDTEQKIISFAALPAPARVRSLATSTDKIRLVWDPVPASELYQVGNPVTGHVYRTISGGIPQDGIVIEGLNPSTTYPIIVRSIWSTSISGFSNRIDIRTDAPAGPAPGRYAYYPVSASTWQRGGSVGSAWRADGDGLYHGNGSAYGSSRGTQMGVFFYGNRPFTALSGARVTKVTATIKRTDDAGTFAGQTCRWGLHNHIGKPSSPTIAYTIDAGSPSRGQTVEVDLPVAWGQALVNGTHAGISWGNVADRYMRADPISQERDNGRIIITID